MSSEILADSRPTTIKGWQAYSNKLEQELATRSPFSFRIMLAEGKKATLDKDFKKEMSSLVEAHGVRPHSITTGLLGFRVVNLNPSAWHTLGIELHDIQNGFALTLHEPSKLTAEKLTAHSYSMGQIAAAGVLAILVEASMQTSADSLAQVELSSPHRSN